MFDMTIFYHRIGVAEHGPILWASYPVMVLRDIISLHEHVPILMAFTDVGFDMPIMHCFYQGFVVNEHGFFLFHVILSKGH